MAGGVGAAVTQGLSTEGVAVMHPVPQMLLLLLLVGVQTGSPTGPGRRLHGKDKGWTRC